MQPGIVMRKDIGLCTEVPDCVRQGGRLGSHLLILTGVLLALETHPCHGVQKLAKFHGKALGGGGRLLMFLFQ